MLGSVTWTESADRCIAQEDGHSLRTGVIGAWDSAHSDVADEEVQTNGERIVVRADVADPEVGCLVAPK
jgi:hypothetical protein